MSSDMVFLSSITPGITQNEWVHLEMPKNNEHTYISKPAYNKNIYLTLRIIFTVVNKVLRYVPKVIFKPQTTSFNITK